jgi:hypothetical protein
MMAADQSKYIGRAAVARELNRPFDVFVVGDGLYYVEVVDHGRERWSSEQARATGKLLIEAADEADRQRAEWDANWKKSNPDQAVATS